MISQFPKSWFRDVYQAAKDLSDVEKKRIGEALQQAKKNKTVRSGRRYDPDLGGWLDNALTEHCREPFRAIVAVANPGGDKVVLRTNDLDEHHVLMTVPHECAVPRDVDSLSAALEKLLRYGKRIVFVDPFFDPFRPGYKNLFFQCLSIVQNLNRDAVCEVHYRCRDNGLTNTELEKQAAQQFPDIVPKEMMLKIFCWRERDCGEDFHARYLLTEKGGIRVDAGFDPIGSHQTTDMALMDFGLSQTRLGALAKNSETYDLVGPILQISSEGGVQRI